MLDKIKGWFLNPKLYVMLVVIFIMIQPLVDLDYLLNDLLKQYGLIVPSTLIRYLGLPVLAVIGFARVDRNKKKTFITIAILGIIWVVYVGIHFITTKNLDLELPANYRFLTTIEIKYLLTMTLPFILMYVIWIAKLSNNLFNKVILSVSVFVSSMILLTDLLVISRGSYGGYTQGNFLSWFMGGYDQYSAIQLTSKAFFQEANVLGALLFILLPLLYKILVEVKRKWPVMLLILVHSLCMMIVGTRVATLGAIAIAIIALVGYLIILVLRQGEFKLSCLIFMISHIIVSLVILPYSPAIRYQSENSQQIQHNREENQKAPEISMDLEGLEEDSQEYNWQLIYIVRENAWLIGIPAYYDYYYPIEFDPVFWKSVLEQPFDLRADGRDLQKLFMEYKWEMLSTKQKLFGTSYSTLSEGGFIIEQDFLRQYYTLGILGALIFTAPYVILLLLSGFNILRRFKEQVTFGNGMMLVSVVAGLGAAYYSGHVLDTLLTSFFIAFVLITLYQKTETRSEDVM